MVLQPRLCRNKVGLGSAAFAHHYSRYHCCFLFLPLLRCFSSGGSPPHSRITHLQCVGLPHSDIQGSTLICSYPWLFAACHVLHRLREPRHPPCALGYFTYPNDITVFQCLVSTLCSCEKISLLFDLTFSFFSRVSFQHVKEPWRRLPVSVSSVSVSFFPCATRVENKGLEPLTPSLQS